VTVAFRFGLCIDRSLNGRGRDLYLAVVETPIIAKKYPFTHMSNLLKILAFILHHFRLNVKRIAIFEKVFLFGVDILKKSDKIPLEKQ
jgi:hypothetical protein